MTADLSSAANDTWPTLQREPYRLFFPLGVALAWAGVLHWVLFAIGMTTQYRSIFHAITQMQGFLACFAVGFLFTFIPRRAQASPPSRFELAVGLASPVFTVVCAWFEQWLLAELGWLCLMALLIQFAARRFRGLERSPPSFVWVALALLVGVLGSVVTGLGGAQQAMWLHDLGKALLLQGFTTCLVLGVGGFLLPVLLRGKAPQPGRFSNRVARFGHAMLGALLVASFWVESLVSVRAGFALRAVVVAAVLLGTAEIWRAPTEPGLHRRLIWVSAFLVPVGYALVAIFPEYRRAGLHVLFIGGFGTMALGVASHVALAHGGWATELFGRPIETYALAVLFFAALVFRGLVDVNPTHFLLWLGLAAGSFLAGTLAWALLVLPRLRARKRPDSAEGSSVSLPAR